MDRLRILYSYKDKAWYLTELLAGPFNDEQAVSAKERLLESYDKFLNDLRNRLDEPEGSS